MRYYILYPDQQKDSIDYDKQLVAEGGMKTVYLQPAWKQIMDGLSIMDEDEFEEKICNPDDIIIFSETGKEFDLGQFVTDLANEYEFVKEDY